MVPDLDKPSSNRGEAFKALHLKSLITSKPPRPPNLATFAKNYLGTF